MSFVPRPLAGDIEEETVSDPDARAGIKAATEALQCHFSIKNMILIEDDRYLFPEIEERNFSVFGLLDLRGRAGRMMPSSSSFGFFDVLGIALADGAGVSVFIELYDMHSMSTCRTCNKFHK